jgi:hypothetical protein
MSSALTQLDLVRCCALRNHHIGLLADQVLTAHTLTAHEQSKEVLSLEALLGLPESDRSDQHQLSLSIGAQYTVEIGVSSDISLQTLAIADIQPLPPLLAARCQLNGLAALALAENQLLLIIDTDIIADKL